MHFRLKVNENEPDKETREEQKAALEEKHYKLRQRANGTVKFIGELYKIDMLTSKIMRTCIELLLMEATEEKVNLRQISHLKVLTLNDICRLKESANSSQRSAVRWSTPMVANHSTSTSTFSLT